MPEDMDDAAQQLAVIHRVVQTTGPGGEGLDFKLLAACHRGRTGWLSVMLLLSWVMLRRPSAEGTSPFWLVMLP